MSAGYVVISIPTESPQGPLGPGYYGRYPAGNAPGGSALSAAANDSDVASGAISAHAALAGAATDSDSATGALPTGSNSLTIVFPQTMPEMSVGTPVAFTISAVGGTGSYPTWSGSGLPPGITVTPSGDGETAQFAGTPTSSGSYSPSITGTDSAGNYGIGNFTCVVN